MERKKQKLNVWFSKYISLAALAVRELIEKNIQMEWKTIKDNNNEKKKKMKYKEKMLNNFIN